MTYATYTDMVSEFEELELTQLSDRDRVGSVNISIISKALEFADDLIDGYLKERYTVPIINPPSNLIGIACDIARYRLYQEQPTPLVQKRYDDAIAWLKDVARGLFNLDIDTVINTVNSTVVSSSPETIFTRLVW